MRRALPVIIAVVVCLAIGFVCFSVGRSAGYENGRAAAYQEMATTLMKRQTIALLESDRDSLKKTIKDSTADLAVVEQQLVDLKKPGAKP